MHPFALNDEVLDLITGAAGTRGGDVGVPMMPTEPLKITPIEPPPETTLAIGEEGGWTPPPAY